MHILTDKSRLTQIFSNLLINAFKFTNEGRVEFGFTVDTNKQIIFFVTDTGIGIPSEMHKKVFERFVQLNAQPRHLSGGNGLGLSITKGLVSLLGGEIWLESEPGKGSTFFFSIKTKFTEKELIHLNPSIRAFESESFTGKTVLVVEDDEYNREVIKEMLEPYGFTLAFAINGSSSVEMALSSNFDIILMDIGLPDISGFEASKRILNQKPFSKIVIQTAYAGANEKNEAKQYGCIDFISKPLKTESLVKTISKYI